MTYCYIKIICTTNALGSNYIRTIVLSSTVLALFSRNNKINANANTRDKWSAGPLSVTGQNHITE